MRISLFLIFIHWCILRPAKIAEAILNSELYLGDCLHM